ncbi:unnamed protein product [Phyllotreta striolata]|uniref:Coiled-coil protein 142 C-terminal domain-containing protein n=1 Tax=Phyllotreta striolata TaxID=444603 RepID=A0A9N9XUZ5_PHYSR|nr:unnamed protein product [Phyllotreta striolata]
MFWNSQIIQKWLPADVSQRKELFDDCKLLNSTCESLADRLEALSNQLRSKPGSKFNPLIHENDLQLTDIEDVTVTLESIAKTYANLMLELSEASSGARTLHKEKLKMWKTVLRKAESKLIYFVQEIIGEITHLFIYYGEFLLTRTLRVSLSYNALLDVDKKHDASNDNSICKNTCPYLIFPVRKVSATRLLRIVAHKRAELCCHKLIDCLLDAYKTCENSDDDDGSDNSSLEIYATLTKHLNVPETTRARRDAPPAGDVADGFASLEELIFYEEKNLLDLLDVAVKTAPALLGEDGVVSTGEPRVRPEALDKLLEFYEQVLWSEVGNFLEHTVLWWSSSPLAARPPHSSQHLREWLVRFIPTADVSPVVLSALASLADALGVHVTSTSWDQRFRLALVAAGTTGNRETGGLFAEVLQDLVMLCNQCESTPEWIVGAPLDELPLVEQIPVLHRLDHSVHTARLWAINECKKIVNGWNVSGFFAVIHEDTVNCVDQLNGLRLADHSAEIEKKGISVHVEVCALMRAKLVSEVKANFDKLKEAHKECVDGLASVCRTICLANLQMIFPRNAVWKKTEALANETPSPFVDEYLNQIIVPVLKSTEDYAITNMILTLLCESWLDHIYVNRIKFSRSGACQLLCDFGYVSTWLTQYEIKESMRKKLLKNEALKRCEGVGRLLLRRPGEKIKMTDKNKNVQAKRVEDSSDEDGKGELMPAEMYVPNQEQWLELRAIKKKTSFPMPICCGEP